MNNLSFLRYFLSAAQTKSVSKAAKANFVSQSAISQAIKKLEIEIGKPLITHEQNRFQLTSEGSLLMEKCKHIFELFAEIEDSLSEKEGIFKGKLPFACTHSFALSLLPNHLSLLSKMHPYVEPVVRLGHTGMIIDLVNRGEVDFGIVLDNDDFSSFDQVVIYEGEYRLFKGKKPLAVSTTRWIFSEERKEVTLVKKYLKVAGIDLESCMEVSSWEVIASLAEKGLGVGFFPDYLAGKRALIPYEIVLPSIPYRLLAIFPEKRGLSRNGRMFIDLMIEN
jgi:DNA-binding transcriptional LysR family regulator